MNNVGDPRTETLRLGQSNKPRLCCRGIRRTAGADVFPRAALQCTALSTEHVTKSACPPRRDKVRVMATPKAKVRTRCGTMEAAGMTGPDTMITIHTAAAVKFKWCPQQICLPNQRKQDKNNHEGLKRSKAKRLVASLLLLGNAAKSLLLLLVFSSSVASLLLLGLLPRSKRKPDGREPDAQ